MKVLIAPAERRAYDPGIAGRQEIMRRVRQSKVLFVGNATGLGTKIVPDRGFEACLINSWNENSPDFWGIKRH